jgi:Sortase family.
VAGWLDGTRLPGESGSAIIIGHLDSTTGPAVFYRLHELQVGDRVSVSREDGSSVQFQVTRLASYPVDGVPMPEVYGDTAEPSLRLITCDGTFNWQTHRYNQNLVVFATIVAT